MSVNVSECQQTLLQVYCSSSNGCETVGEKQIQIELEVSAERYTPTIIDRIELVGTMKNVLERMIEGTERLVKGYRTFYAIYVEGLYGSGKTLLMRKYCSEILRRFSEVIPIYFYLGEQDFLPFTVLERYYNDVKYFVEKHKISSSIVGTPELWKDRVGILRKAIDETKALEQDELEKFFNVLRKINEEGYYPVVVFDEFERVLLTGDGLRSDEGVKCFAQFSKSYLELIRGHIFTGAFALVTTFPLIELLRRAIDMGYPHLDDIERMLKLKIKEKPEQFRMVAPHVVQSYDERVVISWTAIELDLLARRYGLVVHTDVIGTVAKVLPTPRAIINIAREALRRGVKKVVRKQDFMKVIEPRFEEFKERLLREKVDNKFIIQPQTRWHEIFETLLREGMLEIHRGNYLEVAKVLGIEYDESSKESIRKAKQKVSNILKKLSSLQLYEASGGGIYRLNPYLLAYFLGIDRLPSGEETSLDRVIEDIKKSVSRLRETARRRSRQKSA